MIRSFHGSLSNFYKDFKDLSVNVRYLRTKAKHKPFRIIAISPVLMQETTMKD